MLRKSPDVSTENIRTYSRISWAQDTSEDARRQCWQPPWGHEGRCSLELERAWVLGDTTELSSQLWDQQKVSVLSLNTHCPVFCHLSLASQLVYSKGSGLASPDFQQGTVCSRVRKRTGMGRSRQSPGATPGTRLRLPSKN